MPTSSTRGHRRSHSTPTLSLKSLAVLADENALAPPPVSPSPYRTPHSPPHSVASLEEFHERMDERMDDERMAAALLAKPRRVRCARVRSCCACSRRTKSILGLMLALVVVVVLLTLNLLRTPRGTPHALLPRPPAPSRLTTPCAAAAAAAAVSPCAGANCVSWPPPADWVEAVTTHDKLYTADDECFTPATLHATIANGYLGFTIDSPVMYIAGVFNGPAVSDWLVTHRAAIDAPLALHIRGT
jgi:hypothetical protein